MCAVFPDRYSVPTFLSLASQTVGAKILFDLPKKLLNIGGSQVLSTHFFSTCNSPFSRAPGYRLIWNAVLTALCSSVCVVIIRGRFSFFFSYFKWVFWSGYVTLSLVFLYKILTLLSWHSAKQWGRLSLALNRSFLIQVVFTLLYVLPRRFDAFSIFTVQISIFYFFIKPNKFTYWLLKQVYGFLLICNLGLAKISVIFTSLLFFLYI